MGGDIHAVAVNSSGDPIWHCGTFENQVWLHSAAKPFQLLPLLKRGIDLKYGLTDAEIVLLASSHLAQPQHIKALLSLLRKTELQEDNMILSPTYPHGRIGYQLWRERNGRERKRYHPCSGNHAAIMLLQRELTGSTEGYERIDSPAQQEILQYIRAYSGVWPELGVDNCGIPMYRLSIRKIAESYQHFTAFSEGDAIERFVDALHAAPLIIEGDGCIATVLCSHSNLVAKSGVNHLLAVGLRDQSIGAVIYSENSWGGIIDLLPKMFRDIGFECNSLFSKLEEIKY